MMDIPKKQRYMLRKSAMWAERSTWISRYQDITRYLLPYAGRYFATDRNKGDRVFNNIYDSSATTALDIMTAGMMAGMTSPARPWFRLATPDRDLMEYDPVRTWLHDVTELMRTIYAKSNTYNSLHTMYEELGAFATAASIVEDDFDNVINHKVLTAGEYAVAANDKGVVDTLVREFEMTLIQIVEKFVYGGNPYSTPDWPAVSQQVKNDWDAHRNLDKWIPVIHIIEPRHDRDIRQHDAKNMRFASCYFEPGNDVANDPAGQRFLRESGYRRFPVLAPRWHVRGGDIYGNGPSFRALGDIKQLQQEQLRKGQAIDYQTKPPLQVPAERKNSQVAVLPGGISYIPTNGQNQGVRPLFDVNLDLGALREDIIDVRGRINKCFYADLFLMISQDNRRMPATATEIAERHEEKLLMLGPVLERLHNEMLSPKIDLTFSRIVEAGLLPPPPKELQGVELKVEFVSTLAQAQKMVGIGALDGYIGRVAQIAQGSGDTSVWDKVNRDQAIDMYADMFGVDPSVVVADDKVAIIREDRAQAQSQAQQAAMIPPAAAAARDLSQADTGGKNALTDVLRQFQGYNAQV
ncbi:portal protein [Propionivibrio dicarboxylicus]|nr:portal protein [Propionivibrio dicarboxylicus]